MKIAIVLGPFMSIPPENSGAVEKVWSSFAEKFVALGHEVTLFAKRPCRREVQSVIPGHVVWIPGFERSRIIAWDIVRDFVYSCRVLARMPDADVIVTNTFWMPVLLSVFGDRESKIWVNVDRRPRAHLVLYLGASKLRVPSSAMRELVPSWPRSLRSKTIVVPNAIELQYFSDLKEKVEGCMPVITFAGRLHPEKQVHLVAAAYRKVRDSGVDCRLELIGSAEPALGGGGESYLSDIRSAAGPYPISEVGYLADKAQLANFLGKAHLFVYPSAKDSGETFGVAPLEAMAAGCVPIVSALKCFSDFVRNGVNGYVGDFTGPEAADSLASVILGALALPGKLNAMSREARLSAAQFGVSAISERVLCEFEKLLSDDGEVIVE
ncbi:MAG: glycosyltransferase family 4 protein [Acidobacteria bacterium]|nr:glycosyltransferase family 4 protein [Acidobacteriota bacterium]